MDATEIYTHWRERVFGSNPSAHAIPQQVLRDYLDVLAAGRERNRGVDWSLLKMSIPEIKARGATIWKLTPK